MITGGALRVTAREYTRHINVTGGVVLSENVGIGASVGINDIDREVYAVIGSLPIAMGGPWEFAFNQNGDQGQITATGTPQELLHSEHPATAEFIRASRITLD